MSLRDLLDRASTIHRSIQNDRFEFEQTIREAERLRQRAERAEKERNVRELLADPSVIGFAVANRSALLVPGTTFYMMDTAYDDMMAGEEPDTTAATVTRWYVETMSAARIARIRRWLKPTDATGATEIMVEYRFTDGHVDAMALEDLREQRITTTWVKLPDGARVEASDGVSSVP